MLNTYLADEKKRTELGLPALALNPEQTAEIVELLKKSDYEQSEKLVDVFINKVPAGVDPAAYIKAAFLNDIAIKKTTSPYIDPDYATELLSTMLGGYNVQALVKLLESDQAELAVKSLSKSVLIFDSFSSNQRKKLSRIMLILLKSEKNVSPSRHCSCSGYFFFNISPY